MNVRQLMHFLAVLEHASILKASRQLNLSQPALSKSIATLEEHYGVKLFDRQARGVQPTAFALALERHARRILHDVETTRQVLGQLAAGTSGTVALGTGASFVSLVGDVVSEFSASHPDVDFSVVLDHADHLRTALLGNRIDFFVGMYNRLVGDAAFAIEPVFEDRFVGVCARDDDFAGRRVGFREALSRQWVVPELEEAGRSALEAYFIERSGLRPRLRVVTNADAIVRRFVASGGMLTVLPSANTGIDRFAGLDRFELEGFDFTRKVGIVRRQGMISTPLLDRFSSLLRQRLSALSDPA
ncbi:MAG: LysR family transcriptional regulator [Devosia sp.]